MSIITPAWNSYPLIIDTIQSVLNQTYQNWELLIQDDCSSDDTKEYVCALAAHDSRIKYECNKTNSGAAVTRNNALRRAKGRYVAFLDSDDLWYPTKLEKQVLFMAENWYAFSYTNYIEINEKGNPIGKMVTGPHKISKNKMFAYCWPGCLTVMYDASVIGQVQIGDIKKNNDYALWLKVCKIASCFLLDECLAKYRKGRVGSISTQSWMTLLSWHYKLFREEEGMSWFSASFHTGLNVINGLYKKAVYVKKYRL